MEKILLVVGLTGLIQGAVTGIGRTVAKRRAERWARTPHAHQWVPKSVLSDGRTMVISDGRTMVITEECRRCPQVRLAEREGIWAFNRFGELVTTAPDADTLRRMVLRTR